MSVERKPNGKYQARWRDPSEKQRAKTFDRKRDADRFLATMTVDALEGRYVDPRAGRMTVSDYVAGWAPGRPWRPSTKMSRESTLNNHVLPAFGDMPLSAVRTSDVQAWVGRLLASGLAPSTVEAYFRVMAQVMRSARRDRLIAESPCLGIDLPTVHRSASSLVVLTGEQVEAIADAVPRHYRALVIVSAALGLRQGEACALTVDRLDFLRKRVTIDRQVVGATPSACEFGPVKTPSSNRTIPLPESVALVLAEHLAAWPGRPDRAGPRRLVFTTKDGAMIGRQTWHRAFRSATRQLGIDASSHDLRHHAASRLIAAGCSPRAVASILGHRNATETLNCYAHLWPTDEGRITAAIDEWLMPVATEDVHEMCTKPIPEVG